MKKRLKIFVFIAAVFTFASISQSCDKLISAQDVNWDGQDIIVSIPAIADTTSHQNLGTGNFTYNLDSFIKAKTSNSLSLSNLNTAKVSSCTLTIMNPDSADNFANFQSCNIDFSSNLDTTTAHVATITDNPDVYAETLTLPVDNSIDLKSYLYSSSNSSAVTANYNFSGQLRRPTTKTLNVKVHLVYTLHVQP